MFNILANASHKTIWYMHADNYDELFAILIKQHFKSIDNFCNKKSKEQI